MFYSIELLGKKTALGAVWCITLSVMRMRMLVASPSNRFEKGVRCTQGGSAWKEAQSEQGYGREHCGDLVSESASCQAQAPSSSCTHERMCSSRMLASGRACMHCLTVPALHA